MPHAPCCSRDFQLSPNSHHITNMLRVMTASVGNTHHHLPSHERCLYCICVTSAQLGCTWFPSACKNRYHWHYWLLSMQSKCSGTPSRGAVCHTRVLCCRPAAATWWARARRSAPSAACASSSGSCPGVPAAVRCDRLHAGCCLTCAEPRAANIKGHVECQRACAHVRGGMGCGMVCLHVCQVKCLKAGLQVLGFLQARAAHCDCVARGFHPAHVERICGRPAGLGGRVAAARVQQLRAAHRGELPPCT